MSNLTGFVKRLRDIMRNSAIPRNKKLQSIAMMIDAAESGMSRCEKSMR